MVFVTAFPRFHSEKNKGPIHKLFPLCPIIFLGSVWLGFAGSMLNVMSVVLYIHVSISTIILLLLAGETYIVLRTIHVLGNKLDNLIGIPIW